MAYENMSDDALIAEAEAIEAQACSFSNIGATEYAEVMNALRSRGLEIEPLELERENYWIHCVVERADVHLSWIKSVCYAPHDGGSVVVGTGDDFVTYDAADAADYIADMIMESLPNSFRTGRLLDVLSEIAKVKKHIDISELPSLPIPEWLSDGDDVLSLDAGGDLLLRDDNMFKVVSLTSLEVREWLHGSGISQDARTWSDDDRTHFTLRWSPAYTTEQFEWSDDDVFLEADEAEAA